MDGSGSIDDPFLITTVSDLQALATAVNRGNKYSGIYFQQTADIDATGITWVPIGTGSSAYYFSGHYDGGNHSVSYAVANGITYAAGLFGFTNKSTISNINVTVSGTISTTAQIRHGGLIGRADGTTCTNCHVSGSVVNTGGYNSTYVGGLIGVSNAGTYTGCSVIGTISSASPQCGMIGYINPGSGDCTITSCYVDANITSASYGGGIVGSVTTGTVNISTCVCRGTITGGTHNGGIAGSRVNNGVINITNCVALQTSIPTGSRICQLAAGTLVNNYAHSGMLVSGSAVTSTDATSPDGEDVSAETADTQAWWETLGFVINSLPWYYLITDLSVSMTPISGYSPVTVSLVFTSDALVTSLTYDIAYENDPDTWIPIAPEETATVIVTEPGTHTIRATAVIGLDVVTQTQTITVVRLFSGGSGTASDPYLISSRLDIYDMGQRIGSGMYPESTRIEFSRAYYKVINDIDFESNGCYRIGTEATPFIGNFDGSGNTLYNYNFNVVDSNIGMFGYIGSGGVVHDFFMKGHNLSGYNYIGCVAGHNYGTIQNIEVEGNISGSWYVGGIAGGNAGSILNCSYDGNVSANDYYAGGIAARLYAGANIDRCFVKGTISAISGWAGGIVGQTDGLVSRSVVLQTSITGNTLTNRITANPEATRVNCYALGSVLVNGAVASGGTATNNIGADVSQDMVSNYLFWKVSLEFEFGTIWYWNTDTNCPTLREHTPEIPDFADGDGTPENPYLIETAYQFRRVASETESYILLMQDLDLSEISSDPLYTRSSTFRGTFDGMGHTIWGLTITDGDRFSGGIFAALSGTVKNLNVDAATATGSSVGIIAQSILNGGTIQNCHVYNSVINPDNRVTQISGCRDTAIGGIAGKISGSGSIIYCSVNNVDIYGQVCSNDPSIGIGGIVGVNSNGGTVAYCSSSGILTTCNHGGGIAGMNLGIIHDCYTRMHVAGLGLVIQVGWDAIYRKPGPIGGIAGYTVYNDGTDWNIGIIYNCHSIGWSGPGARSDQACGGIAGGTVNFTTQTPIQNCVGSGVGTNGNNPIIAYNGYLNCYRIEGNVLLGCEHSGRGNAQDADFYANDLGWDFDTVWMMGDASYPYPILRVPPDPNNPDPDEPIYGMNWDLLGVFPLTDHGIMWGYRGMRHQP